MEQCRQVTLLGDSILKGIQVDLGSRRYRAQNEMDTAALESEFSLSIHNDAHFGATVRKGSRLLDRMLDRGAACDFLVMDFGGNDCDFRWKEIAEDPAGEHLPNVPLPEFVALYREMIRKVRARGIRPILTNLPPLDSQRFFDWWCDGLNKSAVMRWLGDVGNIYAWQERYSRAVEHLAAEEQVPLVDVRGAFLDHGHLEQTLCADGTHPNSEGQALITRAFQEFGRGLRLQWAALCAL